MYRPPGDFEQPLRRIFGSPSGVSFSAPACARARSRVNPCRRAVERFGKGEAINPREVRGPAPCLEGF